MYRALLLVCCLASPAFAQNPELKIEVANLTRVDGARVEVGLGLFKAGGRGQHPVEIWFVDGARREKLWDNQSTFASTRGGFRSSVTVDLQGRNLSRGKLEIVAPRCTGRACKQSLQLAGGANLKFKPGSQVERQGSDSVLRFQVTNTASVASRPCKLQVDVEGRRASVLPVPAVAPRQVTDFRFRYTGAQRNKPYVAKLVCRDMVSFDNDQSGRLP